MNSESSLADRAARETADSLPSFQECEDSVGIGSIVNDDRKIFLRHFIYDNTPAEPDREEIFRHNLAEVLNEHAERVARAIEESRQQQVVSSGNCNVTVYPRDAEQRVDDKCLCTTADFDDPKEVALHIGACILGQVVTDENEPKLLKALELYRRVGRL